MTDREQERFKGAVRTAVREIDSPAGLRRDTWLFDRAGQRLERGAWGTDGGGGILKYRYDEQGELVSPESERKEVRRHADESRTEIRRVPVVQEMWWVVLPQFPDVPFPTRGGSRLEVTYDRRGFVTEAVFYNETRQITSRVEFKTDRRGNVIEAVRYGGETPLLPPELYGSLNESDRQAYGAFFGRDGIEGRLTFRYDDADRVVESVSHAGGGLQNVRTACTYNSHGDVLTRTVQAGDFGPDSTEYQYEYDAQRNWTRQVCVGSAYETRRVFTYYDESSAEGSSPPAEIA